MFSAVVVHSAGDRAWHPAGMLGNVHVALLPVEYVPSPHLKHAVKSPADDHPGRQLEQAAALAPLIEPGEQAEHTPLPAAENVPAAQSVMAVDPRGHAVPASHCVHGRVKPSCEYVPAGQRSARVLKGTPWMAPAVAPSESFSRTYAVSSVSAGRLSAVPKAAPSSTACSASPSRVARVRAVPVR